MKVSLLIVFSFFYMKSSAELSFDLQGHRGCRGLMPENSIPAFIKAMELKVNTLEMDVVISKDKKVVISHEPWINADICVDKKGSLLRLNTEEELNIYRMNFEEIKDYECGSLYYERFPEQEKIKTYKPLLTEVFDTIKAYCTINKVPLPYFNIEIKSEEQYDNIYAPSLGEYCELVLAVIYSNKMHDHCIIQSFDARALQYVHKKFPAIRLAFLSEEQNDITLIESLLGFTPSIFSPAKEIVTTEMIASCHERNIKVIPWTVNDKNMIKKFLEWKVDGIITDYPDRVKNPQ